MSAIPSLLHRVGGANARAAVARGRLAAIASASFLATPVFSQTSASALRFFGTGTGQQDRVRIQIDDNAAGPDASTPCDVGAESFSLDFWVRGTLADNTSANGGGDREYFDFRWIEGNMVVDRDVWGGSSRDWGVSIAGGFVRFGTGRADVSPLDSEHTLEGNVNVLDGTWHHVAVVRDAATGVKSIYVDGRLDFASPPNRSRDDISYPDQGVSNSQTPWNNYIVLAAEKHDAGSAYPSFDGFMDEFRVWNRALSPRDVLDLYDRILAGTHSGLVGSFRFEEGSGTSVADSSGGGQGPGQLISGTSGNGQWVSASQSVINTAPVSGGILPWGFSRTQLGIPGLFEPTGLEFLPGGRLLVIERGGRVLLRQTGGAVTTLVQFPASTVGGERGLVGVCKDPDFASNGYLYFYWTTDEPRNRVSRLTLTGDTTSLATEFVVWQNVSTAELWHHGGNIDFGPDGNLYIATGDQFDSSRSQPLTFEDGKILRVTPTGGIPSDNPFISTGGARPTIWSSGHRNPFRYTFDLPTGRMYIGNVGGNSADSWEEIDLGTIGANHGWPNQEGPQCFSGNCTGYTFPWYTYRHNDPRYFYQGAQASVTVGPVYRATGAGAFPSAYQGNLFVGDYANRWIRRLVIDGSGNLLGDPLFLRSPDAQTIVDMAVGEDRSLYYVIIGLDNFGNPDAGGTGVFRVAYTAGGANIPPVAVASANVTEGPTPLSVNFSSAGTFDPDGGPGSLTYSWDFGDGTSALANPSRTFNTPGVYSVTMTASDGVDAVGAPPITIYAGNRPNVTITSPAPGTTYRAGDTVTFAATATDVEDGTLPPSAYTWQVLLVHNTHTHPFLGPISGVTSGGFTIPTDGHAPENTYYEIALTVTDSSGLPRTVARDVLPVVAPLRFETVPSGIPIFLDGEAINTPRTYESLVGFEHFLDAQSTFTLDGDLYRFVCWDNAGPQQQIYPTPESGARLVARYALASGGSDSSSIAAANRNADWYTPVGTAFNNLYDALGICVGTDSGGEYQAGLSFALDVPRGATILGATLTLTATPDQSGQVTSFIRAFDVGNCPAFVAGPSGPLTSFQPMTSAFVTWEMDGLVGNQQIQAPDLAVIVQEVVDRADWNSGNHLGVVFDAQQTSGDHWRCFRNFASGAVATIDVMYSTTGGDPPPCCPADFDLTGFVDTDDFDAFVSAFEAGDASADFDRTGFVDTDDFDAFVAAFEGGC